MVVTITTTIVVGETDIFDDREVSMRDSDCDGEDDSDVDDYNDNVDNRTHTVKNTHFKSTSQE